eukprot:Nk52_evm5s249 gene=Nk52_evmTU5s249
MTRTLRNDENKPPMAPVANTLHYNFSGNLEQPLVGQGVEMKAVYVQSNQSTECFRNNNMTDTFCAMGMRNFPYGNTRPQIIAWPLTPEHVQASVRFARKHNLCVSVAGMGHEYLNRHSNGNSFLIRTSLLKNVSFSMNDPRHSEGSITVGAGMNDYEIQTHAYSKNRMVSAGGCPTVGIAGFTLGGGMGPIARDHGLAADNLLEASVVTADGNVVTANENENSDLFWALRGGVGSTWGIAISFTVKMHFKPKNEFHMTTFNVSWLICNDDIQREAVKEQIDKYLEIVSQIDKDVYHMLLGQGSTVYTVNDQCVGVSKIAFFLKNTDGDMAKHFSLLDDMKRVFPLANVIVNSTVTLLDMYNDQFNISNPNGNGKGENILPLYLPQPYPFAYTTLVSNEVAFSGPLSAFLNKGFESCSRSLNSSSSECQMLKAYYIRNDLPGAADSPRADNVSISPYFRSAALNVFSSTDDIYSLSDFSYPNESNPLMKNWQTRYWGKNYQRLLSIKEKYDPDNLFWCRHCVGSEPERKRTVSAH